MTDLTDTATAERETPPPGWALLCPGVAWRHSTTAGRVEYMNHCDLCGWVEGPAVTKDGAAGKLFCPSCDAALTETTFGIARTQ